MRPLLRGRSYIARLLLTWVAAMVNAIAQQPPYSLCTPPPGRAFLFCQEHWIIFIALTGVWSEGELTIRGVEITLLK